LLLAPEGEEGERRGERRGAFSVRGKRWEEKRWVAGD
jgi:hypothetical protein